MTNELAVPSQSLYVLEQDLQALLDTEDLVSPEARVEFETQLATTLTSTVAKRDRCGEFLRHCENQAEFCKAEAGRLHNRAVSFCSAAERMRGYLSSVIKTLGVDPKGKHRRLEGEKFTFSLRTRPPSIHQEPDAVAPAKFVEVYLTLPAQIVADVNSLATEYLPGSVEAGIWEAIKTALVDATSSTDKRAMTEAIKAGESIPGFTLVSDDPILVVK